MTKQDELLELLDRADAAANLYEECASICDNLEAMGEGDVNRKDAQLLRDLIAEIERLRPTDDEIDTAGRMAAWVRDFGREESSRAFVDDVLTLLAVVRRHMSADAKTVIDDAREAMKGKS